MAKERQDRKAVVTALYDPSKGLYENIEQLKQKGISIGSDTLKKYLIEVGIPIVTDAEMKVRRMKEVWERSTAPTTADLILQIYEDTGIRTTYATIVKHMAKWEAERQPRPQQTPIPKEVIDAVDVLYKHFHGNGNKIENAAM